MSELNKMQFNTFKPIDPERSFTINVPNVEQPKGDAPSFQSVLSSAVGKTNDSLKNVDNLARQLATGELKNLHDLTIAQLKAETMLKLTTQVASKLTSAAQSIFQMQV